MNEGHDVIADSIVKGQVLIKLAKYKDTLILLIIATLSYF